MTDPVSIALMPPAALIAFDLWSHPKAAAGRIAATLGGALPDLGQVAPLPDGWRAIRVEPTVWWLSGPLDGLAGFLAPLEAALGEDGAATDLSGGIVRISVAGPAWRELLMFGGVFDAESPAFGVGSTAGTLLHHVNVRYDVIHDDAVHIHLAPSHAADLLDHLRAAALALEPPAAP